MLYEISAESATYAELTPDEDYVAMNVEHIIQTPGAVFLVDDAGDGLIIGTVGPRWHSPDIVGYEEMFFVRKHRRGSILGYRLLKRFEQVCTDLGAQEITVALTTGINPESTIKFYKAMGYEPHGQTFSKRT